MNDTCPTCNNTKTNLHEFTRPNSVFSCYWCPKCGSLYDPPLHPDQDWQAPATHNETTLPIHEFLKEHRQSTGGWAEIEDEDVSDLCHIIQDLIKLKCDEDPDGDYPIEFDLVNRLKGRFPHFHSIPYDDTYGPQATRDALIGNARMALDALETHFRCEQHRRQNQEPVYLRKRRHFVVKGTRLEGTLIGYDRGKDGTEYALIRWPNSNYTGGAFDHHCLLPSEIWVDGTDEDYRFLNPDEIIILGDQLWDDKEGWGPANDIGDKVQRKGLYRRRKKEIKASKMAPDTTLQSIEAEREP